MYTSTVEAMSTDNNIPCLIFNLLIHSLIFNLLFTPIFLKEKHILLLSFFKLKFTVTFIFVLVTFTIGVSLIFSTISVSISTSVSFSSTLFSLVACPFSVYRTSGLTRLHGLPDRGIFCRSGPTIFSSSVMTVKYRTAIKALFLYFTLCLNVLMVDSHSCLVTPISILTNCSNFWARILNLNFSRFSGYVLMNGKTKEFDF